MEERYNTLILGRIRKWWDQKTPEERRNIICDVVNFGIGVSLVASSAAITAQTMKAAYAIKEAKQNALKAQYSRSNIAFRVNSEDNTADLLIVRKNPENGDILPLFKMSGDVETFNETAKAFSDAAAYVKTKSGDNQYAKVVYDIDSKLKKYQKPM